MQQYNQQMDQQYNNNAGYDQFAPQQQNLQSRSNTMGLRRGSGADLDTLRSESKMRLQQGLPYRPNNESTNSGSR